MSEYLDTLGLTIKSQLDDVVSVVENADGQPFYWINHPKATALIAAHGAHIISYHPTGKPEQLWLSKATSYAENKAIRGGVPICWPWFSNAGSPSHGYARISRWDLAKTSSDATAVTITLQLTDAIQPAVGFPFLLECQFTIGDALDINLITHNTGTTAITIGAALHTYFATERDTVSVSGMGTQYLDKVQHGQVCEQQQFALAEETDRIYTAPQHELTIAHGNGHTTKLVHQGEDAAVIWNPGDKLAATMADVHAGGAREYLCVESVKALAPATIAPGSSYTLRQLIQPQ